MHPSRIHSERMAYPCANLFLYVKMVTKVLNNHKVVFYDGIEDLPIKQFHRYSKYTLIEGNIGDTIEDIDKHITRVMNFLGDEKKARQELMNLRQCLYAVATEQDFHNKATLCLVKSVDGKEWTDFSDDGLDTLFRMVEEAPIKDMEEVSNNVRKAIDDALLTYFPSIFEDSLNKNYTDLLRRRALLQLRSILDGTDNKSKIAEVTKEIYAMQNPKGFDGKQSEEIRFDKQFEDMCLAMAKEFGGSVKGFSVMEFYTAYEHMERQSEQMKKMTNRRKR